MLDITSIWSEPNESNAGSRDKTLQSTVKGKAQKTGILKNNSKVLFVFLHNSQVHTQSLSKQKHNSCSQVWRGTGVLPFRKHSYNCWQLVVTYNLWLSSENPSENILVQLLEAVVTYNKMLSSICTGCCFYRWGVWTFYACSQKKSYSKGIDLCWFTKKAWNKE